MSLMETRMARAASSLTPGRPCSRFFRQQDLVLQVLLQQLGRSQGLPELCDLLHLTAGTQVSGMVAARLVAPRVCQLPAWCQQDRGVPMWLGHHGDLRDRDAREEGPLALVKVGGCTYQWGVAQALPELLDQEVYRDVVELR